jgi:AraC family ethanolamine operon transcriptional activator
MVSDIITMASACSEFESSVAADRAAADVFELISRAVGYRQSADHTREGRPKYSRDEIIDRALGYLSSRRENSVRIAELANASDVSERTLRAAFNEYFGMGPVKYLRLRQLHSVRRSLLAADPNQTTVSSVLMDHEEWAFSRFAADYRRLFGELPSATLRR